MTTANTYSARPRVFMNIRAQLLRRIGRQWKAGDRLPPIRELAGDLGSGYVNTHRAIRALADEGLLVARDRVGVFVADDIDLEAIHEDAAAPDPGQHVARPLAGMRVHVLLPKSGGQEFRLLPSTGFVERMRAHYCDVEIEYVDPNSLLWRDMTKRDCEAVALIGHCDRHGYRIKPGTALVISYQGLFHHPRVEPACDIDAVTVDHFHGGLLAGQALREAGVESACFIGRQYKNDLDRNAPRPNRYDAISMMRLEGFEEGFGQAVPRERQFMANWYGPGPGARVVPDVLKLKPRPQAIFTATDELAIGFIHGAQSHGLEPGEDYQIIGFDGQQTGRELVEGPLTTIDIPAEEMGRRAADLLAERMLNPDQPRRQLNLGCSLFEGNTVRTIK